MISKEERESIESAMQVDNGFMKEFIEDFIRDSAADLKALDNAIYKQDGPGLVSCAHGLKSVVGLFQATTAHGLARELEEIGKIEDFPAAAEKLIQLKEAVEELEFILKGMLE